MELKDILSKCDHTLLAQTATWDEIKAICDDADVPTQAFANKSDMAGGSTLGKLSNMQASMHAVDVGLPQLAMHSSYETGGVRDVMYAIRALTAFYERNLTINGAESVEL